MTEPTFDADGYPTDLTLTKIEAWPVERGFVPLMEYVRKAWRYADSGYWREKDPPRRWR